MTATAPQRGSSAIPQAESAIDATPLSECDAAVDALQAHKEAWLAVEIPERIAILRELMTGLEAVAEGWVAAACGAKGVARGSGGEGEEWLGGPFTTMRNLRLLIGALKDVEEHGRPMAPGPVRTRENGQLAVKVFPAEVWDKLFYAGFTAEIWLQEGPTAENLAEYQASCYRLKREGKGPDAKVALVLGAGNVASIGPMDALYKLFVEDQVCVLKMNPVNDYLGPFIEKAFRALIDRGYLRVVYGGAPQGIHLCQHDGVDEIHITGSDKTHDAIVYGVGEAGREAKANRTPTNTRRVTSELGNVSPVIVVPGPWSESDLTFHGVNLASMLTNNAGFNCNATRVIVTHEGWDQRDALLNRVRGVLQDVAPRRAYYPGAADRFQSFIDAHPEAEKFGNPGEGELPWTLITGVAASESEICTTTEAFCSVFSEMPLSADSVVDYIKRAVRTCNDDIWGTLNASIIVHPKSLKDPAIAAAVDDAIRDLRYGAVAVNHWPALAYGMVTTTWGGYPGHELHDIQSGREVVHNTFMFDKVEKTVVRGPFRVSPKPPWFVTNSKTATIARRLFAFEAKPSWLKVPAIAIASAQG
jgi:acyl-CoA reductase-like NAD-dependent aldehyde dehydrogenase